VPVRPVEKILLVDRLQQHHNGTLRHLVREGRNTEPALAAVRLGNVMTTDWRRSVTVRLELRHRMVKILLVGRILFSRLVIHPHRAVLARTVVGVPHPLVVDVLVQGKEGRLWFASRRRGYVFLFC